MGRRISSGSEVLDFGCGCGRTITWMADLFPEASFHGVDVDEEAISWCRTALPKAKFQTIAPTPPLPYLDDQFDIIYCISVFTHFDEEMQDLWLHELTRVLKSDGVLLLTVHGEAAVKGLDADARHELETRGFAHRRSEKLRGMVPERYHTTWHSQGYIETRLRALFSRTEYQVISDGLQNFVLASGKAASSDKSSLPV